MCVYTVLPNDLDQCNKCFLYFISTLLTCFSGNHATWRVSNRVYFNIVHTNWALGRRRPYAKNVYWITTIFSMLIPNRIWVFITFSGKNSSAFSLRYCFWPLILLRLSHDYIVDRTSNILSGSRNICHWMVHMVKRLLYSMFIMNHCILHATQHCCFLETDYKRPKVQSVRGLVVFWRSPIWNVDWPVSLQWQWWRWTFLVYLQWAATVPQVPVTRSQQHTLSGKLF
jgi:hypothetical protein